MAKHKKGDEVIVTFTRKQAEYVECLLSDWHYSTNKGQGGTKFSALRRMRRALGTWKEPAD